MCEIFDGHLLVLSVRTIEPVALSRRPGLPELTLLTDAVPSQCVHPRRGSSSRNGRSSLHLRGRALHVRRNVLRMEQWHMRRSPEQIQRRHVGKDHLF